ncbi:divalent-cation tolerance protein CutA [Variovorax sp. J22R133]|uniref:divalent-cation tolerance protein CutA n=1 Tax=Variovorax brevis TaxID=3053503 RepID=UPI002576B1E3|nr:divalent-cation tolerance protein CutA [Variovorax sp. J22R133]MDM0117103.1 divalent-cation tolerance protein CutA [Variovorax sp. J22R133]
MTAGGGDTPCIVMTAAGTEDEAENLATAIVEARLAACVQVHHVRSFYSWQGEMRREPEWVLMAKTRSSRFAALEAFIRARHSYETPEIIQLPITAGSTDYLAWLAAGTVPVPPAPAQE